MLSFLSVQCWVSKRKNRQRNNILWYNPPHNVNTNIGHKFLSLIDKHFPKDHSLRKILTATPSKSVTAVCITLNRSSTTTTSAQEPTKHATSDNGNCLQSSVVYQAIVTRNDNNTSETYIGLTETDFKTRHRNHTASFRHAKHKNSTELSKHIWTLKNDNIDYSISWRVLSSNSPYNSSSKRCNLCLKEKFLIICRPDLSSLNKRNGLVSSCQHRNKALLRNSWTLKF